MYPPADRAVVEESGTVKWYNAMKGFDFIASDRIPTPEKANLVMLGSLAFAPARIRRELRHLVHHFHHHLGSRRLTLLI
jgi:hypothetical protein